MRDTDWQNVAATMKLFIEYLQAQKELVNFLGSDQLVQVIYFLSAVRCHSISQRQLENAASAPSAIAQQSLYFCS